MILPITFREEYVELQVKVQSTPITRGHNETADCILKTYITRKDIYNSLRQLTAINKNLSPSTLY